MLLWDGDGSRYAEESEGLYADNHWLAAPAAATLLLPGAGQANPHIPACFLPFLILQPLQMIVIPRIFTLFS